MRKPQLQDFLPAKPAPTDFGITLGEYERAKAAQKNGAERTDSWAVTEFWAACSVSILLAVILGALGADGFFCLGVACVAPVALLTIWFVILPFIAGLREGKGRGRCENPVLRKIRLYEQALVHYNEAPARYHAAMALYNRTLEDHWKSLRGTAFENELAMLYRKVGYSVRTTKATGDRGVDLILEKNAQTVIVQCKGHEKPAGVGVARDLYGALIDARADSAVLACPSGFTKGVVDFVRGKPIELVDARKLVLMAESVEKTVSSQVRVCVQTMGDCEDW